MFTIRTDIPNLDFAVIKDKLEELLEASANLLEREWPSRYNHLDSARIIFFTRMRLVINMYATIMWISADIPEDPRRKMLVLSASPLVRALFEELMSLIFLFNDLPNLVQSLVLTNFTEVHLELQHARKYHDHKPEWQSYIARLKKRLQDLATSLNLTADQISNPKKNLGRWPTPGKMIEIIKLRYPKSNDIEFMEYIRSWIYRSLSGDTHLNFEGLIRRGNFYALKETKTLLGIDKAKAVQKESFDAYRMEMIWTMLALLLSIISEIEGHFHFGLSDRAKFLWTIFVQHSDLAKEFFDLRYKPMLGGT